MESRSLPMCKERRMIPCPSCGHDNPAGMQRCQRCDNPLPATAGPTPPAPDIAEQIRTLLQQGRKIEAIKVYRQATGAGLAEAKSAVEGQERNVPPPAAAPAQDFEEELLALLRRA